MTSITLGLTQNCEELCQTHEDDCADIRYCAEVAPKLWPKPRALTARRFGHIFDTCEFPTPTNHSDAITWRNLAQFYVFLRIGITSVLGLGCGWGGTTLLGPALLCLALLCFSLLSFALLCYATLCSATLCFCFALLCYALLCFTLLCHAVLCFPLLCFA
jgi:hypothetical protein